MQGTEPFERPERDVGGGDRVHRDDQDADGGGWAQAWDDQALLEGFAREEREREREREAVDEHRPRPLVELGRAARDAKGEDGGRKDDGGERRPRSELAILVAQRREDDGEAAGDERDRDERDGGADRERDGAKRAVVRFFAELSAERGEKPQPRAGEDHRGRRPFERARFACLLRHAAQTFARETRERDEQEHRRDREAAEREPASKEIDAAFADAHRRGHGGEERRDHRDGDGAAESREEAHSEPIEREEGWSAERRVRALDGALGAAREAQRDGVREG